jgi:hypothetical protein
VSAVKPIRIQLSRKKGWRMPPNTVKVDRTTKWGNPYKTGKGVNAQAAVAAFRNTRDREYREMVRRELRGKNLACWCGLDETCHADVLLEIAASEELYEPH